MSRTIKTLAVVLLLAIMPLRGLAAVTVGFCAMGHEGQASHASVSHEEHGNHTHGHGSEPAGSADCSTCAEHCSSASFAVPAPLDLYSPQRAGRICLGQAFAAGFVPEHLDPPPLAL